MGDAEPGSVLRLVEVKASPEAAEAKIENPGAIAPSPLAGSIIRFHHPGPSRGLSPRAPTPRALELRPEDLADPRRILNRQEPLRLVTLLFPLFRLAPPIYCWRIRRKIFRWYGRVLALEKRLRESQASPEQLAEAALELDRFDDELTAISVPVSYADELYHLRLHLRMVRDDLQSGRGRWAN